MVSAGLRCCSFAFESGLMGSYVWIIIVVVILITIVITIASKVLLDIGKYTH